MKTCRRALLPPSYKHMRSLHPRFRLRRRDDGGWTLYWRGRRLGRTEALRTLPRAPDKIDGAYAFIVASGPSLAEVDLGRLRGRRCFGVNGSIAVAEPAGLRFDYHVITDRRFVRDRFELTRQVLLSAARCLLTFRVLNDIAEREPALLERDGLYLLNQLNAGYGRPKRTPLAFDRWAAAQPRLLLHPQVRGASDWVGFSRDLELGVFSGQTVVFSTLQIAYALGYRQVYILGMDLGGGGNAGGAFRRVYETAADAAPTRLDRDYLPYTLPAFEVLSSVCESTGFRVYNLSANSRLPASVIPKISLDAALARHPTDRRALVP